MSNSNRLVEVVLASDYEDDVPKLNFRSYRFARPFKRQICDKPVGISTLQVYDSVRFSKCVDWVDFGLVYELVVMDNGVDWVDYVRLKYPDLNIWVPDADNPNRMVEKH